MNYLQESIPSFIAPLLLMVYLTNRYAQLKYCTTTLLYANFRSKILFQPIKQKIHFMYIPFFDSLLGYQKLLLENSNFEDSEYLIMGINSYFRGQGYLNLHWNQSFKENVFSKKIIMMSEEDITINHGSFNKYAFQRHVKYVIGSNDVPALEKFFGTKNVFTHLSFAVYAENHNSSYQDFVNRPYYVQSAISNVGYCVNSNRVEYLKEVMNHFGNSKVANFGGLFFNQKRRSKVNSLLPPTAYFGFSMENSIADYWITEKLFTMYKSGVIPIYRGSIKNRDMLADYGVNVKAFIDASNMTINELITCLDSLINEEGKKKLYELYLQPLIPNKAAFDLHIRSNLQEFLDYIDKQSE